MGSVSAILCSEAGQGQQFRRRGGGQGRQEMGWGTCPSDSQRFCWQMGGRERRDACISNSQNSLGLGKPE